MVTVHPGSVPLTIELPGRTSPYLVAQVRARVDGIVLNATSRRAATSRPASGSTRSTPRPIVAALNSARAALQKAQANLVSATALAERYKVLVAANAVSKQDYDNAVAAQGQAAADVAAGKAAVETAQINLGYTNVVSPIAGRIGTSLVTQGAYVQASAATLMTTVQQIDPIYVDLTQSSVDGLAAAARHRERPAEAERPRPGEGDADPRRRHAVPAHRHAAVHRHHRRPGHRLGDGPRDLSRIRNFVLLPGMFVRARIDEGVDDNALLVPQVGVTHDPQGPGHRAGRRRRQQGRVAHAAGDAHARRPVGRRRRAGRRRAGHRRRRAEGAARSAGAGGREAHRRQPPSRPRLARRTRAVAAPRNKQQGQRMARFFIDRPIFAIVIAMLIMLAGGLSILTLPIEQYPPIAPPTVQISTTYPGRLGRRPSRTRSCR